MQRVSIVLSSNSFSYLKCHLLESPYLLPPVKCKLNYRHIIKSAYSVCEEWEAVGILMAITTVRTLKSKSSGI